LRITLDNPAHVADLTDFLRRCECRVDQAGPQALDVEVPIRASKPTRLEQRNDAEWDRMEIGAFLRVWQLLHPEAQAHLFA
jgi:hypothetical protein